MGIISLILCTNMNQQLVNMSGKHNAPYKIQKLMRTAITLATLELTTRDAEVIGYNFEYTFYKFCDIIKNIGLTNDFQKILSYFRRRKITQNKLE